MILGIVPARGGSAGIPGKNMVDVGGRPLLDYTLRLAEECRVLDRVILSTDMADAIEWTNKNYSRIEVPFLRPAHLCGPASSSVDVVLHAVDYLEQTAGLAIDSVVLLQPTCPFRRLAEVTAGVNQFMEGGLTSLVGVSRVWHHPGDYVRRDALDPSRFVHIWRDAAWTRRQDFPEVLFITGALYVCRSAYLRRARTFYDEESTLHLMSDETMVDIDSPFDLAVARGLVAIDAVP
jgi:CMP-N,N'-diacetyllegionaminic acid synthase